MTSWIVSYDLKDVEGSQDYQPLWDYFEAHGAHRVQESLWFLSSSLGVRDLTEELGSLVHKQDRIFVSELVKNNFWQAPLAGTYDWEKANPPSR
ncbi:hypothetical protein [Gluconobacter oxydans]|uniref:hypothetical protein n=1 Tax=Gluconobacter oxydans TaxID=442 RepID=UPI00062C13E8|nr:hypothetical protein [Gluconobacter oxydans]